MRPYVILIFFPALAYLLWTLVDAKDPLADGLSFLPLHKLPAPQAVRAAFYHVARVFQTPNPDLDLIVKDSDFMNSLASWMLPDSIRSSCSPVVLSWFRNFFFGCIVYLGCAGLWAYYVYFCFGDSLWANRSTPTIRDMLEQIKVAMMSLPGYAMLPAFSEYLVEKGYTKAYPRIDDVGLVMSVCQFFMFMVFVEFGVYWSHRILHYGWGYKHLHAVHHKYNKENSLSPFAGLAFHPVDGILQAVPYTITLFIVPTHFFTHLILLFATGVWTTNIHDCVDGRVEPVLGAAYHTIHHTTYKDNYGHYFIFMDWLFGTLTTPEEFDALRKSSKTE